MAHNRTGFAGNLTAQQQGAFTELMSRVDASAYADDLHRFPHSDWFALRFLRATMKDKTGERVFQVEPAFERLVTTLQWRRDNNLDVIRTNIQNNTYPADYVKFLNEIRPRMQWIDPHSGRPVQLEKLGVLAQNLNMEAFSMEKWEEMFTYDLERNFFVFDEESAARGAEVGTKITIFDLSGIGMGAISRIKMLKMTNGLMAQHYPEIADGIYLFNTGFLFATIFAMVQPILDADTQNKIVVSSKFDLELLGRVLGNDVHKFIPVEYGGTNPTPCKASSHAPQ